MNTNQKIIRQLLKLAKQICADADDLQNGKILVGIWESITRELKDVKDGIDDINQSLDKLEYKDVIRVVNRLMQKEIPQAQEELTALREQLKNMSKTYQSKRVD